MLFCAIKFSFFTLLIGIACCSGNQASAKSLYGTIKENSLSNQTVDFNVPILSTITGQQVCTYKLEPKVEKGPNPFIVELVNSTTGQAIIRLARGEVLDHEVTNNYVLILTAEFCGGPIQTSKQELNIMVLDVNEYAPEWTTTSYVVDMEEGKLYDNILKVKAIDKDGLSEEADVCWYHLLTPDVPFQLDNKTGILRNTESLDYSSRHNYILEVVAEDCRGLKSESIFVNILIKKLCVAGWNGYRKNIHYKMTAHKAAQLFPRSSASLNLCDVTNCSVEQVSVSMKLGKPRDNDGGDASNDYEVLSEIDRTCDMDDASVKRRVSTCDLSEDTVEVLTVQHIRQLSKNPNNHNKNNNNNNINNNNNNNNNNDNNNNGDDDDGYYFDGKTAYDVTGINDVMDNNNNNNNNNNNINNNNNNDNDNDNNDNENNNNNNNNKASSSSSSSFLMTKSGPRSKFTISTWMRRSMEEGLDAGNSKQSILCSSDNDGMSRSRISLYLHNCHLVMLARFEPSKDPAVKEVNARRRRRRRSTSADDDNDVNNKDAGGKGDVIADSDKKNDNSKDGDSHNNDDDSREWVKYSGNNNNKKGGNDVTNNNNKNGNDVTTTTNNNNNNNGDDSDVTDDNEEDNYDENAFYRHSEWHWKLEQVCDSRWHHYTVMVDQDVARLFVDGNLFPETQRNPFVIDDRALHNSKRVHGTKLTVGACWKGLTGKYGDYLKGHLAGLLLSRKSVGSAFSEQAVRCLNNCNEKLDFHSVNQMESGMSISMNSQMTELTINGKSKESVEHLISRVAYVNPRLMTSSSSAVAPSVVTFQTSLKCREDTTVRQVATDNIKITFNLDDGEEASEDNNNNGGESEPLLISGTEQLDVVEDDVRRGVQIFRDVLIYPFPLDDDSYGDLEKEAYLSNEIQSCNVRIFPELDDDVDSLIYSNQLVHSQHLIVNYTPQEIVIKGPGKVEDFVSVLKKMFYVHLRAEEVNEKTFHLVCYRGGSGRLPSQQLTVQLNVIHYDYSDKNNDKLTGLKVDFLGHNKIYNSQRHLPLQDDTKGTKSDSKSGSAVVVMTVVLCAVALLAVIAVGTYRMVTNRPKTVRVHVDNEQDLQWDKSTITITVNPLDVTSAADPLDDDDDEEGHKDDNNRNKNNNKNDVINCRDDFENNNLQVAGNDYADDDDIGSAHEMMKDDEDDDDDDDVSKINHLIISDTE